MNEELKTSEEWNKLDDRGIIVYDPDGWDRKNYQNSWFEELITKKEYDNRLMRSTCIYTDGTFRW